VTVVRSAHEAVAVNDVGWTRALTFAERLAAQRAQSGGDGASITSRDRLRQWRNEKVLSGDKQIEDPPELHACTELELLAVLSQSPEELQGTSASARWLADLARAFSDPAPLALDVIRAGFGDHFVAALARPLAETSQRLESAAALLLGKASCRPFEAQSLVSTLRPSIADELEHRLAAPLVIELHACRSRGELDGDTPEERFASFISRVRSDDGCIQILGLYPVLARVAAQRLSDWLDTSIEFATRLVADWNALTEAFPDLRADDHLESIERSGDPHRRGRAVMIARFRSGATVVYKPRPVTAEARFQDLLGWLNEKCELPDFRTLTVVEGDGYGWVEFVAGAPCDSRRELERFFVRQGGYLALLYVLGGVDFHSENLIAAGEHPVLVDLETLFHGVPASDVALDAISTAEAAAATTVLRTGLLPHPILGDEHVAGFDPSGLGGGAVQLLPLKLPHWERPGTDEMRLVLEKHELPAMQNRALAGNELVGAENFVPQIRSGFRCVYETLREHAQPLLGVSGAITAFADAEMRAILRSTLQYSLVLETSLHPDFLGDALEREQRLDRFLSTTPEWRSRTRLIAAERRDLWHTDIPIFVTCPASTAVWTSDGERIDHFFTVSGMELTRERLTAGETQQVTRVQEWIITKTLATAAISDDSMWDHTGIADAAETLSRADFLEEARTIAERLHGLAIVGADDATWMTIVAASGKDSTVAPMGPDLYGGLAGPALFLAYLSEVDGDRMHATLARRAVKTMLRQVDRGGSELGIGGFSGLGGIVYVLTSLACLWDDRELLNQARRFARQIEDLITGDAYFDFLSGAAGAIRTLLVLDAVSASAWAVDIAVRCGDHLLRTAVETGGGIGWVSDSSRSTQPLAGLAHGTAGIAWTLIELAARSGDERFAEAGAAAIAYERSLFSEDMRNWRDVRIFDGDRHLATKIGEEAFMSYWCHGSAGVGLARVGTLQHWDDGQVQTEIRDAVAATYPRGFGLNHSLCHGDLGNLEFIVKAPRPLVDNAAADPSVLASRIVTTAREHGWVTGHPLGLDAPDLMLGLAGIGYAMLRLAAPDEVPSVLTLDSPVATGRC
jgi:type 2 lantibiotic biosynthesis protein LanM